MRVLYDFTQGEDLESNVPFDAQGLVDQINQTATVDETQGFVQNVDQAAIEAALADYQTQIEDYINNQNPDATVGEVLGIQKIIVQEYQQLAAGLPYQLVARTNNYSEIPDNLRHKFRYTLGTDSFGNEGNRLITFEQSLSELAGKKHALSFKPTTQADEDLINSYIPEPDPVTGEIDPSQLPNSLPGYLINLTAEFTQNGEVVHSAAAGTMGGELYETLALWSPAFGWDQAVNHPVAGEYRAIGLDLQGANPEEAARLQQEVEATQAILDSGDQIQIGSLSKDQVSGDIFHTTILSYMGFNSVQNNVQAKMAGMVTYSLPSYGLFGTSLQPSYFFGVPRNVGFGGLAMDVDRLASQSVAKDNDRQKSVSFLKLVGSFSSILENLVPEQLFSTEDNPVDGISAVKALAIASAQGQRIWEIDQNNLNEALDAINLNVEIERDIRNAVLAGKVATAHEHPVNFAGGSNAGYLLIDPETGAGAYLIASGANGGLLDFGSLIDFIASILGEFSSVLAQHFGRIIGRAKQVFDFANTAGQCGLSFSVIKFLSVLVFTVGLTLLLLPYTALLGLVASVFLVSILRILFVELTLAAYFSSKFTCRN